MRSVIEFGAKGFFFFFYYYYNTQLWHAKPAKKGQTHGSPEKKPPEINIKRRYEDNLRPVRLQDLFS